MVPDLAGKKEIIMKKLSSAPTMKDVAREAGGIFEWLPAAEPAL